MTDEIDSRGGKDNELVEVIRRLAIGDELFWTPERLVPFEHWVGHIPFAFWLMKTLRPHALVELGTHRGNSYCAFCQAVTSLRLNCHARAVDTWQGDLHVPHEEGLLADLKQHHDPRYDAFSRLLEMTFDEAREHVMANSVDLLHIDGEHTYEAVKHDFMNWKDTLTSRGVVLFHDIAAHQKDFGVWRFWSEISREYPSFAFSHSYGLGVLGVGAHLPTQLQELFALDQTPELGARARALFEMRGQGLISRLRFEQSERERRSLTQAMHGAETSVTALQTEIAQIQNALDEARMQAVRAESDAKLAQTENVLRFERERERLHAALRTAEAKASKAASVTGEKDAAIRNLQFEVNRLQLDVHEARTAAHTIETSTMWRLTRPIRRLLDATPKGVRRSMRRGVKLLWLIATFRLFSKLREMRESRRPAYTTASVAKSKVMALRSTVVLPSMTEIEAHRPNGRIAVVAHLHYPELWPELRDAINVIPEQFDLFMSLTESASHALRHEIHEDFPNAQVVTFPNHGRDMLPFLTFAATGVLNRYDLVCKVHAKRTIHRQDGDAWRRALLSGILRDTSLVQRIIRAFEADPDLGIVVGDGQIFGSRKEHWTDNRARVLELGSRIGVEEIPDGILFPGGSMFWIRPFLLRTVSAMRLTAEDFEPEPLPIDGTTAHAVERLFGVVCADAGMRIDESSALPAAPVDIQPLPVRVVAYYLPQYHPTPENDAWWGKGFTEWTNVTRARPMFQHHRQPRLPADLGFYDLRLPQVREAQADLARRYGVGGFCYYYYWFNGKGLLRTPLDDMVASGRPDFPFMVCWANEPWSRNWSGGERELLMSQEYAPGWARSFARDIAPLLADERYIRVDGKPLLLIYRIMHIPERDTAMWEIRDELHQLGVGEVQISAGRVGFAGDDPFPTDPRDCGADSWFEFPPHLLPAAQITHQVKGLDPKFEGKVYSYRSASDIGIAELNSEQHAIKHPAVMAGWDNTARNMLKSHAYHGATPALLRRWLRTTLLAETRRDIEAERIVFVNAWNEWAEGTYLEPDRDFGHGWLEAVASAIGLSTRNPSVLAEPTHKEEAMVAALARTNDKSE